MNLTTAEIPQADVLWDVARVPEAIIRGHTSPDTIGAYLGTKGLRQGNYYIQAARVIGLVEPGDAGEPVALSKFGRAFAYYNRVEQRTALRRQLLRYEPTRSVVAAIREREGLSRQGIAQVLQALAPLASSTAFRRAATVATWLCEVGLADWDHGLLRYCGPSLPIGPAMASFTPLPAPGA